MADSIDILGLIQSGWVRNAHVACAALAIYEHFLQFGNEVELFWKKSWTLGKILFLCCRYLCLLSHIVYAALYLRPRPTYKLCHIFFYGGYFLVMLQVAAAQLILQLRLYAMYDSTRKIRNFFITVTLCESVALITILVNFLNDPSSTQYTNEPLPGVTVCAFKDGPKGHAWFVYSYGIVILNDGMMFVLALRKAWLHRAPVRGFTLMQQLTRDSMIYFLIISSGYLFSLIIISFNRITLNGLSIPFPALFSSIFANRLLIGVRLAHYGDGFTPVPNFSLRFASNDLAQEEEPDSVEFSTFNERIGT